jgi:DNA replication and repair protein RecF
VEADLEETTATVDAREGGRMVTASLGYAASGERRLTADGAPLADTARWEERMPVRVFLPDDLRLVKGSPRRRRDYLDSLAAAGDPAYLYDLSRFEEALTQRNTLLRRGVVGDDHAPWEALMARAGLRVVHGRARAIQAVAGPFSRAHAALAAGAGPATLAYRTNVADLDEPAYRESLARDRGADRQRTFTHLGPQRDDLRFMVGGRDLREYGSQGEQRTALLALLVAERERALTEGRRPPLLLLDDVMSELDHARRRALMAALKDGGQVVVTTTDLHYFTDEELAAMRVVDVAPTLPGEG